MNNGEKGCGKEILSIHDEKKETEISREEKENDGRKEEAKKDKERKETIQNFLKKYNGRQKKKSPKKVQKNASRQTNKRTRASFGSVPIIKKRGRPHAFNAIKSLFAQTAKEIRLKRIEKMLKDVIQMVKRMNIEKKKCQKSNKTTQTQVKKESEQIPYELTFDQDLPRLPVDLVSFLEDEKPFFLTQNEVNDMYDKHNDKSME